MSLVLLVVDPASGARESVMVHAEALATELGYHSTRTTGGMPPRHGVSAVHWVTVVQEGIHGRPYHKVAVFRANGSPLEADHLTACLRATDTLDRADWGDVTVYRRALVRA